MVHVNPAIFANLQPEFTANVYFFYDMATLGINSKRQKFI